MMPLSENTFGKRYTPSGPGGGPAHASWFQTDSGALEKLLAGTFGYLIGKNLSLVKSGFGIEEMGGGLSAPGLAGRRRKL